MIDQQLQRYRPGTQLHRYRIGGYRPEGWAWGDVIEGDYGIATVDGHARPVIWLPTGGMLTLDWATDLFDCCDPDRNIPVQEHGELVYTNPMEAILFDETGGELRPPEKVTNTAPQYLYIRVELRAGHPHP